MPLVAVAARLPDNTGIGFGAATPMPVPLVHPFKVWATVYVAAVFTVMAFVVAALLHNREPVKEPAVNVEFPQLSTTVTVGVDGIAFGTATALPASLVHPLIV